MKINPSRLALGFIFLAISGLIVFGLIKFGTILGFFLFYAWLISRVSGVIINPHLINIVAIILAAIIYFGLYRYIYRRNKTWGFVGLIILLVLQSAFMFLSESDRFFSLDGRTLRYYTVNPVSGEYQMFDRPIYDAFGQKAQPVTFRLATSIYRQQNEKKFPNNEVDTSAIKNFFSAETGKALIYYSHDNNGYHFFMHPGFDPRHGIKLLPVTPEVISAANPKAYQEPRLR